MNMKKFIAFIMIIMIFVIPIYKVEAKTLGDLKNELSNLEKKYAEAQNNKNMTTEQINNLTSEINTITNRLATIKNDIKNTEDEIKENEETIEKKKEETNELLKFLQVSSGENVYLEYLFEADSYTDFIYRYAVVSQLTNYNNNLMKELEELIASLEKKKEELANNKTKLENSSRELESKMVTLRANLSTYQEEGTTIEQDIADMKKEIKRYTEKGCNDNENITTCGTVKMVNATGWNYPLARGCVTSEYTGYGYRADWDGGVSGHHGIDLDCVGEGTPVYSAANGTVARVVYRSSCGGNMVWVYHNVNGTPYTTVYMHLLSINVSEGQSVTPSSVIGGVGGGSTRSYDYCTGGTHLHFGMAYGHNAYSFNPHSFNPRNAYGFPALVYSGGGYFSR